jgi:hypothetical protein
VSYGQSRVQVVWNRIILPDTSSLTLDNLVGTDPAGYAGLEDDVDWHWGRIFAGAALTTLLGVGAELAAPENRQDGNRIVIAGRDSAQDSINQVGQEMTRRNMNIQPTLTARPGLPVRIIVNRDLVLRPYQPLFFNRGLRDEHDQEAAARAAAQDRSVKLTFACPASLKADLDRYAALHAQAYGEAVDAVTLIPHMLEAFMAGDRGFASSSTHDDTARKLAELYIGSLAVHVGIDVALDSPTNAKGDNPDVMFTLQECDQTKPPQRWALAIKTISSTQGQTIFERIKEAAEQIDAPKCLAERGMVVINAKSALDHDALWNPAFADLGSAMKALSDQLDWLIDSAEKDRPQIEWDDLFTRKVVRPVLFLGQSLVRPLVVGSSPTRPTSDRWHDHHLL